MPNHACRNTVVGHPIVCSVAYPIIPTGIATCLDTPPAASAFFHGTLFCNTLLGFPAVISKILYTVSGSDAQCARLDVIIKNCRILKTLEFYYMRIILYFHKQRTLNKTDS